MTTEQVESPYCSCAGCTAPHDPWIDVTQVGYELDRGQLSAIAEVNALTRAAWSWAQGEIARRATTMPAHLQGDAPCRDCGTPDNISWHVDSDVWNAACPPEQGSPVLCPRCFVVRAYRAGIGRHWKLTPEGDTP